MAGQSERRRRGIIRSEVWSGVFVDRELEGYGKYSSLLGSEVKGGVGRR